jgi:hypothetical protein
MSAKAKGTSIKRTARIAGALYLLHFVTFFLADNDVHATAVGSMDFAATVRSITASGWLFRFGFVSYLLTALFFLLAAWALYVLLKPVNVDLALLFVLLNLGGVAVWCIVLLFEYAALLLVSGADYLSVFQADQLQALAMLSPSIPERVYDRPDTTEPVALSSWLPGFQVGLPSPNSGHIADH